MVALVAVDLLLALTLAELELVGKEIVVAVVHLIQPKVLAAAAGPGPTDQAERLRHKATEEMVCNQAFQALLRITLEAVVAEVMVAIVWVLAD
jgi:hypothetical protein